MYCPTSKNSSKDTRRTWLLSVSSFPFISDFSKRLVAFSETVPHPQLLMASPNESFLLLQLTSYWNQRRWKKMRFQETSVNAIARTRKMFWSHRLDWYTHECLTLMHCSLQTYSEAVYFSNRWGNEEMKLITNLRTQTFPLIRECCPTLEGMFLHNLVMMKSSKMVFISVLELTRDNTLPPNSRNEKKRQTFGDNVASEVKWCEWRKMKT